MATSHTTIQLPFTTSHAFIIGINDYEEVSPLSTAVNDAKALAKVLAEDHGYRVHPPLLNAGKADIVKLLEEDVPRLVKAQDRVFFYFAGHGIALDSDDDPKGYLVPVDARPGDSETLVAMDSFHQAISGLPCQHGMLILDCCFAGAFKWSTGFRDVVFDLPGIIYEERFYQYAQDPAWQVITSSASDQKAVDILSDRTLGMRSELNAKHSPFALALLDGLAGEADTIPKAKGDGVITATELYTYLRDRVEDETMEQGKRQSPAMFSLKKHDKGQFIFLHPRHPLNLPPIPKRNPFMGLKSYDEENAGLFYGRDSVISTLCEMARTSPLIVVSGASGTGKSSVIKAGLLPQLRKQGYAILPVVRPGKEPLRSLQSSLSLTAEKRREKQSGGFPTFLFPNGQKAGVLIIDQYEELITQCLHEEERYAFERQLAGWLERHPDLRIIISVRSDFEPQFADSPLAAWWRAGRYTVPGFSQEELREVIIKPTVQEVLFFEPDTLVDQLVDAVNQAPGALPLLSFTLSELYHMYLKSGRTNRAFVQADYDALGGVIGALSNRANAIHGELDAAHRRSMQKLMLHMVSLNGGEAASSRVKQKNLIYTSQEETERIQVVAGKMVDARLLSTGIDQEGNTYYEPAHDALVRAWDLLWDWIKKVGEVKIQLINKLGTAVEDFEQHQHENEGRHFLWHNDPRLDILLADLKSGDHSFNAAEEAFIKESHRFRTRNKHRLRAVVAGVIIGLVGLSIYALIGRQLARDQALQLSEQQIELRASKNKAEEATQVALLRQSEAEEASCLAEEAATQADAARLEAERARQTAENALAGMQVELLKETVKQSRQATEPRTTALVGLQAFLYNYEHPQQGDIYEPSVYNSLIQGALGLWKKNFFYIRADFEPIRAVSTQPDVSTLFTISKKTVKAWEVEDWKDWGIPKWKSQQRVKEVFNAGAANIMTVDPHPRDGRLLLTLDDGRVMVLSPESHETKQIPIPTPLQIREARWLDESDKILLLSDRQVQLLTLAGQELVTRAKLSAKIDLVIPAAASAGTGLHLLSVAEQGGNNFLFSLQSLASPAEQPEEIAGNYPYGQPTAWDYYVASPSLELFIVGTDAGNVLLRKRKFSGRKNLRLEDFASSIRKYTFSGGARVTAMALDHDRSLLFAAADDGRLMVVDLLRFEQVGYQPLELEIDNVTTTSLDYYAKEQLLVMGKSDGSVLFFHYDPLRFAQCICEKMETEAIDENDAYFDLLNETTWNSYFRNMEMEQRPPCERVSSYLEK